MKKLFALWLTLLLCLSLTACGGSGSTDPDDVAGDDWRVTGVVRDTGTITRNGGDVDVLVCINADSADFYYDDATPVMYDYAAYPSATRGRRSGASTSPTGTATATATWRCCSSWTARRR